MIYKKTLTFPGILLIFYAFLFIWTLINPYDWNNWIAEIIPVLIVIVFLVLSRKKIPLHNATYGFLSIWIFLHTIGAKYSFALVPIDFLEFAGRNQFDRIAHFSIGFWAIFATESVWRLKLTHSLNFAMFFGVICIIAIAGLYEIIEWVYAVQFGGEQANSFLGSQGDIWDAQKDILMDSLGGVFSVFLWRIFIFPYINPKK